MDAITHYIYQSRVNGISDDRIKRSLLKQGWHQNQLDIIFASIASYKPKTNFMINKKSKLELPKPPLQTSPSTFKLHMKNNRLYIVFSLFFIVGVAGFLWPRTTISRPTFQSVLTKFVYSLQKGTTILPSKYETSTEAKALQLNHSAYNSCSTLQTLCAKAMTEIKLKDPTPSFVNYRTSSGVTGEEALYALPMALQNNGCPFTSLVHIAIALIPSGDGWLINQISISSLPKNSATCQLNSSSKADTTHSTTNHATTANRSSANSSSANNLSPSNSIKPTTNINGQIKSQQTTIKTPASLPSVNKNLLVTSNLP